MHGQHPMRRKDKVMTQEAIERFVSQNDICHIVMNGENGYPYVIPINYVYSNGIFILHSAMQGLKMDLLKADPRVCLEISKMLNIETEGRVPCKNFKTEFISVIAFGKIEFPEGEAKIDILSQFSAHYMGKAKEDIGATEKVQAFMMRTGVLTLKPDYMTGKSEVKEA